MTESKNGAVEPGVYVKGDVARRAATPSEAAKYVWDGFVLQDDEAPAKSEEKSDEAPLVVGESAPEPEKRGPGRPRKPAEGDAK